MDFLWDSLGYVMLLLHIVFIMAIKKFTNDNSVLTSKYREKRDYEIPFPEMLEMITKAMNIAGFKKINVSPKTGAFTAQTGFSMSSPMEFIEVRCEQTPRGTAVDFLSICALPTQIYAWGKNKRNARRFFDALEKQLRTETA